jgi:hypothetical protein
MSYTLLRKFDVEPAEVFPYLKVALEIMNPWNIDIPFYTFIVLLKVQQMELGHYLYVGEQVNTEIKPGTTLSISSYLKIIDIHADEIRKKILSLIGREQFIEITSHIAFDILNYSTTSGPYSKKVPLERMLEWLKKAESLRNDFIPAPSHNALISMLYRDIMLKEYSIEKRLNKKIEDKLAKLELSIRPLKNLFEKGLQEFMKNSYKHLMPLDELIKYAASLSKNFDENWALASLSLILMENVVKLSQVKLGLEPKGSMSEQIKRLTREVEKLGIKLDYPKLAGDWEKRRIAVHEAYEASISEDVAKEAFKDVKELIEKLSPILKRPSIYVIDWSPPEAPLTRNRVIVVDNEAYYMGEPYDSWVKRKNIMVERRPSSEDYHKYLESIGVRCTHKQPQSIEWLENKLKQVHATPSS